MGTMDYSGDDFYCDVALKGLVELRKEYESEAVLAFHHTRPFWPIHIVVIPKKHIASLTSLTETEKPILDEMIEVIKKLARKIEVEQGAARVLTNLGQYQDSKHLHIHVSSGEPLHR